MSDLTTRGAGRRTFLKGSAVLAGAATVSGFESLASRVAGAAPPPFGGADYGPLSPVADDNTGESLIALPAGFSYTTYGRAGDLMDDGIPTPNAHDGMAAFSKGQTVTIVRNHERGGGVAAFADGMTYDPDAGGGTTTLTFDRRAGEFTGSRASLAGTIRNCAGGPTPWGSWLSCEETTDIQGDFRHGYVFEVPADGVGSGVPLTEMGRFSHEAVAVDPRTGIVYLTEDDTPSGLYRYLPNQPGSLAAGGRLQMLKIGSSAYETYTDPTGTSYGKVRWVDIEDPDPGPDDISTVDQGLAQGGASIRRGEGIWYGNDRVYIVSTNGGPAGQGQVFELNPRSDRLRVLFASPDATTLNAPDNVTVSPRGGIVLCEDGSGQEFMHGLTTDGEIFPLAQNVLNTSEWAGATFDDSGEYLFANLQSPGITFAITGPWDEGGL